MVTLAGWAHVSCALWIPEAHIKDPVCCCNKCSSYMQRHLIVCSSYMQRHLIVRIVGQLTAPHSPQVKMEPIVAKVTKQRQNLKCAVCGLRGRGGCIQCDEKCYVAFHPLCAFFAGHKVQYASLRVCLCACVCVGPFLGNRRNFKRFVLLQQMQILEQPGGAIRFASGTMVILQCCLVFNLPTVVSRSCM